MVFHKREMKERDEIVKVAAIEVFLILALYEPSMQEMLNKTVEDDA